MDNDAFIKKGLHLQRLPIYESDISYIQNILCMMKQTEASLHAFPYLNMEVSVTVVDKGLMR